MDDILELGSILEIKDMPIPIMVIGYFPCNEENSKVFDYLCIPHLLGMMGETAFIMINQEDINKILFRGLRNKESESFLTKIIELSKSVDIKQSILNDN